MNRGNFLRVLSILILFTGLFFSFSLGNAQAEESAAVMDILTGAETVNPGETFTADLVVAPGSQALAGLQFDLSYDPAVIRIQSVGEGTLFSQGGSDTFFLPGNIDNETGKLTNVAGVITAQGGEVSGEAVFATVTFQALGEGESPLTLSNVVVGNKEAQEVPFEANRSSIRVAGEGEATRITVGTAGGTAGSQLVVPVTVSNAAGLAGGEFTLVFDEEVAVPTQVAAGELLAGFSLESNLTQAASGRARIAFASDHGISGDDGELLLITFQLTGAAGSSTTVEVHDLLLYGEDGEEPIPGTAGHGSILVASQDLAYGDLDRDGEVTAADAVLVLQDVIDLIDLDENQRLRGDVSGEGEITAADAILILRYVVELISQFPVEN